MHKENELNSERGLLTPTEAFSRDDLDAWLTSIRIKSQNEIESEAARYIVTREINK